MSHTIRCELYLLHHGNFEESRNYLVKLGLHSRRENDTREDWEVFWGEALFLELKHKPEILTRLEADHLTPGGESTSWAIGDINEHGVTLYECGGGSGEGPFWDCRVFIPRENILAIHDMDWLSLAAPRKRGEQNAAQVG